MSASQAEEAEQIVSLVDVLQEEEELEDTASAVLGGSDSDQCSYPQGHVKRQALYACNTCTPKGGEAAGVCLACSYNCHEGHDLFELYTKRNFRCDCGNKKFRELQCKFYPEKEPVNSGNKYSHNFFGLYCTCDRPYPDPEDEVEDVMIQCIVCEDWLHGRHLGCLVLECVEQQEMICESCMNKHPFLWTYAAHLAVPCETKAEGELKKEESHEENREPEEPSTSFLSKDEAAEANDGPSCKRSRQETEGGCRLKELQAIGQKRVQSGAVFWPSAWRSKLCSCITCQKSLAAAGVSFLLDETDTVLAYENKGKNNELEQQGHDPLMSALDNLNRVQQLEIIHEYNDLKTELKDFLQSFAAEGKVVTSEDIRQFFEQQQSRKRRRVNTGQFYCRPPPEGFSDKGWGPSNTLAEPCTQLDTQPGTLQSMAALRILGSVALNQPKGILKDRRSIYTKPPKNKIGAGESFLIFSVFAAAMLVPAGWILHHLPEYRQRPHPKPKA
ncbi:putative E3 ubiquitin-protein ligase UBR7 [Diretmus argenteus]